MSCKLFLAFSQTLIEGQLDRSKMTRMAAMQAREFQSLKQLLSPQDKPEISPCHVAIHAASRSRSETSAKNSFWILIGTLLIAHPTSRGSYRSSIKFPASMWTPIAFGLEVPPGRSFGRPYQTFRIFRVISMHDPVWIACALGNLEQMDRLIANGQASPHDEIASGGNLLHVSKSVQNSFSFPNPLTEPT